MGRFLGHKAADAVEVCDAPPSGAVILSVDDSLNRKGVWRKVVDSLIDSARSLVNIAAVDTADNRKIKLTAGTAGFSGQLPAAQLATDAVETAKIKDVNVTTAKVADFAITPAKLDSHDNWIVDEGSTFTWDNPNEQIDWSNVVIYKSGVKYTITDGSTPTNQGHKFTWLDTGVSTTTLQSATTQPAPAATVLLLTCPSDSGGTIAVVHRRGGLIEGYQIDDASKIAVAQMNVGPTTANARLYGGSSTATLDADGSDTNIDIDVVSKGSGDIGLFAGSTGDILLNPGTADGIYVGGNKVPLIVQRSRAVETSSPAEQTATSTLPIDNSAPTQSEGVNWSSLNTTFTPKRVGNVLRIRAKVHISINGSTIVAAWIAKGTGDAVALAGDQYASGEGPRDLDVFYEETVASLSAVTWKVFTGTNLNVSQRLNGIDTGNQRYFGGALISELVIEEWLS